VPSRIAVILAAGALVGCASVSEVVPAGGDTLMVAAQGIDGNGSGAAQKAIALTKANDYCKAHGAMMEVLDVKTVEPMFGRPPSADLTFRCAKAAK
jgi:hypothetical protein